MRKRVIIGQGVEGHPTRKELMPCTSGKGTPKSLLHPVPMSRAKDTLIEETTQRRDLFPHADTTDSLRRLGKA